MTKAATRATNVRTPGVATPPEADAPVVPTTANGETDADALADAAEDLDGGAPVAAAAGDLPPDLQSMVDAAVAKGVAQALHAQRVATSHPVTAAELPDQSEIDRKTITRPTLSKQGYVIPDGYGEPKANVVKD